MSINITEFFKTEFINFAAYDNIRKICSECDGLKLSQRKIIWTFLKKNITKEIKVSRSNALVSAETEYLHGEDSLGGVTVNLAQNFTGTNNIPLLAREGNFGNRLIPEAAANRYIFTHMEEYLPDIFKPEDIPLLTKQIFEGKEIEPKFLLPILPLVLVNGNEGMGVGFAQKVLPRNPKEIIKYIKAVLKGKSVKSFKLLPYYNGFKGTVNVEDEGYLFTGIHKILNTTTVEVTELPLNYDLGKYIVKLEKLEEQGVITSFDDLSSKNDGFKFKIRFTRAGLNKIKTMSESLKLTNKVTENHTYINVDNSVSKYKSPQEVINKFINFRLKYYDKRKVLLIKTISDDIKLNISRFTFIKGVIDGTIVINKKSKEQIIKKLSTTNKIITVDDSYEYLLRMPIYTLTKEKITELANKLKALKEKLAEVKHISIEDMWIRDLDNLQQKIGKII